MHPFARLYASLHAQDAHDAPAPHGPPKKIIDAPRPYPTSPGGRPRKLDGQAKELVCCLLSKGHTLGEAAAFVACDRDTILNERKRDPQFDANVKRARKMRTYDAMDVVCRASRTSWRAAAWLLEYHRRVKKDLREARLRKLEAEARMAQERPCAPTQAPRADGEGFSAPTPSLRRQPPPVAPAPRAQVTTRTALPPRRPTSGARQGLPKNRITARPSRRRHAAIRLRRRRCRASVGRRQNVTPARYLR
jgi:hypothetical protein